MPDIRSERNVINASVVDKLNFSVIQDFGFVGFKVHLFWKYEYIPNLIGFKIYKAQMSQPRLKKNYLITQRTLEQTSAIKNFSKLNNILFNKTFFSQNSKVKFENSNSSKHDKVETALSDYKFVDLGFVRSGTTIKNYEFYDRNIKFGESYIYYVSAILNNLKETKPVPVYVNIESLKHPYPVEYFEIFETDQGLLLQLVNKKERNLAGYQIFKRRQGESEFKQIAFLDSSSDATTFLDIDIIPKKNYFYKVYAQDIYGNISLSGPEKKTIFNYVPYFTSIEKGPIIEIDSVNNEWIQFKLTKIHEELNSVRIERRDDWRFEKGFQIKKNDEVDWENQMFFSGGVINFIDKNSKKEREYSYKITGFNLVGFPISYFITPPFVVGEKIVQNKSIQDSFGTAKIIDFLPEVLNQKQSPVFVKFNWKINGPWNYLVIKSQEGLSIKVDSIHKEAYISNFKIGNQYNLSVELYDFSNKKIDEIRGLIINL